MLDLHPAFPSEAEGNTYIPPHPALHHPPPTHTQPPSQVGGAEEQYLAPSKPVNW